MKSFSYLIAAGVVSFALPALAQDLVVRDAYLTPLAGVENAAGLYMVILNNGKALDTLLGATSDIAGASELLATISDAKGMPQLVPQPQGKEIMNTGGFILAPGGYQVALLNLASPLKPGEKVMVTLKFATAGDVPVEAVVK
ncbi:MAG: copper chaperone PCu(A)C [Rhodobacteraceae bacterium]|nr:copper chaperone PCu(A)C [Paracoccaceae bacterium]